MSHTNPLPPLPKSLLELIGEYGCSHEDRISGIERTQRWLKLIDGIKDYAAAYDLGARSTAAQPVEPTGPWLDDEGRAMIANSHHYTAANIKAIVDELNCLSDPDRTPLSDIENKDLRTWFGVLARIITGLAHEVPTAPAASGDSTPPSEPRPVAFLEDDDPWLSGDDMMGASS